MAKLNKPPATRIFLTGGIGDVLALESFFTPAERQAVETVYYASRKNDELIEIMKLADFPSLKAHVRIWDDFSTQWCFHRKRDYFEAAAKAGVRIPYGAIVAEDWGILIKFQEIHRQLRHYHGSTFFRARTKPSLARFGLPARYVVVCPYSVDKRRPERDFTAQELGLTFQFAGAFATGVIINQGDDKPADYHAIIDLSNQTTLEEAIAILEGAMGYIGVDSALSVLAAKCLPAERVLIKSNNPHLYSHTSIYYAPANGSRFLTEDVVKELKRFAQVWTPSSRLSLTAPASTLISPSQAAALLSSMTPPAPSPTTVITGTNT
jgi:hypothetical protein